MWRRPTTRHQLSAGLNESPSEKEGKYNLTQPYRVLGTHRLNESPSEKEGKSRLAQDLGGK